MDNHTYRRILCDLPGVISSNSVGWPRANTRHFNRDNHLPKPVLRTQHNTNTGITPFFVHRNLRRNVEGDDESKYPVIGHFCSQTFVGGEWVWHCAWTECPDFILIFLLTVRLLMLLSECYKSTKGLRCLQFYAWGIYIYVKVYFQLSKWLLARSALLVYRKA